MRLRNHAARWPGMPLLLGAAMAWSACALPAEALAQAGAEAALLTLQSTNSAMGAGRLGDRFRLPEFPGVGQTVVRGGGARAAALPARPRSGAPGEVSGRLVNESGDPIGGIVVGLLSTDPRYAPELLEATSDSTGRFRFTGVEPGPWALRFDPAKLPARYAPRRASVAFTLSRREKKELAALTFLPGACVLGSVHWTDGPAALETEIFLAPADTAFFSIVGRIDGEGGYRLCGIPAGRAHVWSDLGDGRWLGRPLRLEPGSETQFDLVAEPSSQLSGTSIWFDLRTEDGRGIGYAEIVVFGVHDASATEPRLVYLRGAVADRVGSVELLLPHGEYEVLAMNPREGEWARTQGLVIDASTGARRDRELVLTGASSASQRAEWVQALRERAEQALYLWASSSAEQP